MTIVVVVVVVTIHTHILYITAQSGTTVTLIILYGHTTYSKKSVVWINRVRLPILLVIS